MSRYQQKGGLVREAGWIEVTDANGHVYRGGMRCCVHCGGHFLSQASEKLATQFVTAEQAKILQLQGKVVRGYCYNCAGPICGPACAACVPMERQLENAEAGRPADFNPIWASMPRSMSAGGILLG